MNLAPDVPEDPRQALSEVCFDMMAAARLLEGVAQQTDMFSAVLCGSAAAISKALKADADRLQRSVRPALVTPAVVVKDGEDERASAPPTDTPPEDVPGPLPE